MMSNGCTKSQVSNECAKTQTLNGWKIELTTPTDITQPATTFQYVITRVDPEESQELSNIRICLCPGISDEERSALLESCSYTVTFDDPNSTTITSSDCFIDNRIPNPNENPAACKGLKFDNIPSGDDSGLDLPEDTEQAAVTLNFTLTRPLAIGPANIGFKAGLSGDVWMNICAPICDGNGNGAEPCIAYKFPESVTVTCPSDVTCPPFNTVPDLFLEAKEINCCILQGFVLCGTDNNNPVANVMVFATSTTTGRTFAGITNDDGQYSICVPGHDTYTLQAFCCSDDCCEPTECICNCNGDMPNGDTNSEK